MPRPGSRAGLLTRSPDGCTGQTMVRDEHAPTRRGCITPEQAWVGSRAALRYRMAAASTQAKASRRTRSRRLAPEA
jgi:hypothetical protein